MSTAALVVFDVVTGYGTGSEAGAGAVKLGCLVEMVLSLADVVDFAGLDVDFPGCGYLDCPAVVGCVGVEVVVVGPAG